MYIVPIPQRINQIITIFHRCGMWEDETVSRKMSRKLIYLIFYLSFVISLVLGGFLSDNRNESIFLVAVAVQWAVLTIKLIYILWKKKEILEFVHKIGVHSVTDFDEFTRINTKVNKSMKFNSVFMFLAFVDCLFITIFLPLFSREKVLPLNIAFPLDWKNSEIAYWMAYAFVTTVAFSTCIVLMLNIVIWYIMMSCSIKYETLGNQFRNMGSSSKTKPTDKARKITEVEKQKLFQNELIALIKVHRNIQETIEQFKSCISDLFIAQLTTSGFCICGGVYILAFSSSENLVESPSFLVFLVYNLFDIFVVMYFGNEIKLSSDRLSYCLFESNWIEQSQSCKKCIIILVEVLKQPHQLIIGKLYPLDLETFIAILNLAYSMFNILQSFK